MDSELLSKLAQDVMALLKEYDIPAEKFTMSILVPREYYQTIKGNFPDRHPADVIVGHGEESWGIQLRYSQMTTGEINSQQGQ